MKKQKLFLGVIFSLGLFFVLIFGEKTLAAGSATVSWIAPTTDEGGGALTGLAGYRVYYDTTSHWTSTCPVDAGTYETVTGGGTTSYHFNNDLTAGQTYYFTVMAYDDDNNISGCASDGTDTEVSLQVTYSGDIDATPDHDVDSNDFTLLASDYGKTSWCGPTHKSDINRDCVVNSNDFTILASDYGNHF